METVSKFLLRKTDELKQGQYDCDFFELIRFIDELSFATRPCGFANSTKDEAIKLKQAPKMSYAKHSIESIAYVNNKAVLEVNFMGLLGTNGPLPIELSDFLYKRAHNNNDTAALDFLNIINHKFISLFYRAFFIHQQSFCYQKANYDYISKITGALAGLDGSVIDSSTSAAQSKAFLGFFSSKFRSAENLRRMLIRYFSLDFKVEENVEDSYLIPSEYRAYLNSNLILGDNIQIGSHFYSNTKKFLLKIEFATYNEIKDLFPGEEGFFKLTNLVANYINKPLDFDLIFYIQKDTIPQARLDGKFMLGGCVYLPSLTKEIERVRIVASRFLYSRVRRNLWD